MFLVGWNQDLKVAGGKHLFVLSVRGVKGMSRCHTVVVIIIAVKKGAELAGWGIHLLSRAPGDVTRVKCKHHDLGWCLT